MKVFQGITLAAATLTVAACQFSTVTEWSGCGFLAVRDSLLITVTQQ